MASPIGPGDWVECVTNVGPRGVQNRLTVGAVYRVVEVGETPPDDLFPHHPWVKLAEVPVLPGKLGFRAEFFRPIYRPKQDLIESLKAPPKTAPAREREAA